VQNFSKLDELKNKGIAKKKYSAKKGSKKVTNISKDNKILLPVKMEANLFIILVLNIYATTHANHLKEAINSVNFW